ncbi:hypothetical protein WUBG_17233 [Wuchereria bancrofti]|nr:hypothetical protein WUBG_17233 [Wuchereria bancrofti]
MEGFRANGLKIAGESTDGDTIPGDNAFGDKIDGASAAGLKIPGLRENGDRIRAANATGDKTAGLATLGDKIVARNAPGLNTEGPRTDGDKSVSANAAGDRMDAAPPGLRIVLTKAEGARTFCRFRRIFKEECIFAILRISLRMCRCMSSSLSDKKKSNALLSFKGDCGP